MTNQLKLLNLRAKKKGTMKEKIITLKVEGAAQGQWSSLLLELNLMKQAWKPYGVNVELKAHSIKKIIEKGTSNGETLREARRDSKKVSRYQKTIL